MNAYNLIQYFLFAAELQVTKNVSCELMNAIIKYFPFNDAFLFCFQI